jgi:OCT family organic cation transporter-like MFS transporter 4/5
MCCRFSNALIYYGVSLFVPRLAGDDFLNFFISGAVEIPGYLIAQVSIRYFGRRIPLCVTMLVGGIALLVTMAIPEGE